MYVKTPTQLQLLLTIIF